MTYKIENGYYLCSAVYSILLDPCVNNAEKIINECETFVVNETSSNTIKKLKAHKKKSLFTKDPY